MRELPILFNDEMVRAILDGRKTQTRRVLEVQPPDHRYRLATCMSSTDRKIEGLHHWVHVVGVDQRDVGQPYFRCPYVVGDRLWVREAFAVYQAEPIITEGAAVASGGDSEVVYRATYGEGGTWKPSIHMPRWASRITLEVTDVRVERLQDISEDDAEAEGFSRREPEAYEDALNDDNWATGQFKRVWDSFAKRGYSWETNPWVWVIEFKRVD